MIASGSLDSTVRRWDSATGQLVAQPLQAHQGTVWSLAFHPDGNLLFTGGSDRKVIFWDLSKRQPIAYELPPAASKGVGDFKLSPDGHLLAEADTAWNIIIWHCDERCASPTVLHAHRSSAWRVAFHPSGQILASAGTDRPIRLWNTDTGQAIGKPLTGPSDDIYGLSFSPDGKSLVAAEFHGRLLFYDWRHSGDPSFLTIRNFVQTGQIAFSPDGSLLAVGATENVFLVDTTPRKVVGTLPLTGTFSNAVAFTPDGQTVAAGAADKIIRLFSVRRGKQIGAPLIGHKDSIEVLAFSPDVRLLASGGEDNLLILWDLTTGRALGAPLPGHTSTVSAVAFHPTKPPLATGDWHGNGLVWNLDPEAWFQIACTEAGRVFQPAETQQYLGSAQSEQGCSAQQAVRFARNGAGRGLELVPPFRDATALGQRATTIRVLENVKKMVDDYARKKKTGSTVAR
jgi:WD40 repeat protein